MPTEMNEALKKALLNGKNGKNTLNGEAITALREQRHQDIRIRSSEVQEIISKPPNWMVRVGITLIFIFIVITLAFSWLMKYPDILSGTVTITTQQPPVRLVSQANGYITDFYIENGTRVEQGTVLAEISSPIKRESVKYIRELLLSDHPLGLIDSTHNLGEMQSEYNNYVMYLKEYQHVKNDIFYLQNMENLQRQKEYNQQMHSIAGKELKLIRKEMQNAKSKFETDSLLHAEGIVHRYEFYSNHSEWISAQQRMVNAEKAMVQNRMAVLEYTNRIAKLKEEHVKKEQQLRYKLEASRENLENFVNNWRQNYTLRASVDGKISYLEPLVDNQYVSAQTELFAIIPENQEYVGWIKVEKEGYGKLEKGQEVRIKLDHYPYQEFGKLIGKVQEISLLPNEDHYLVKVTFSSQLTTYGKHIHYVPDMSGTAEIVTDDVRLLMRIFNNIRKITDV